MISRCEGASGPYTEAAPSARLNAFRSAAAWGGQFVRNGPFDASLQELGTGCISGNCTFPIFNSLGVCSTCRDVLDLVSEARDTNGGSCTYSLPNGLLLPVNVPTINISTTGAGLGMQSYGDAQIVHFSLIKAPLGTLFASECTWYWCVRSHQSSILNGVVSVKVTASWYGNKAVLTPGYYNGTHYPGYTDYTFSPPPNVWADLNLTTDTNYTVDGFTMDSVRLGFQQALGLNGDCVISNILG